MNIDLNNQNVVGDVSALGLPTRENDKIQEETLIYKIIKRLIDIIGAMFGILTLIPITIGIYIAKMILKENGPMFYSQNRIGKDGKIFKIYKFRSMVVDADEKLDKYLSKNEEAKKEYKENKKLKDDPRITKIGKFIRKTSLDEFPQFINVLKGEMSLVGPRPYLQREIDDIGEYYPYIVAVKPGITGLWQVSGRSDVCFKKRLQLDVTYYNEKSLILDISLILKTIKGILKKDGAI